jgi:hypothetical protein
MHPNTLIWCHNSNFVLSYEDGAERGGVQSKAWTVFAHSNAGIVDSNPTQGMNVCVCVFLCVDSGLATGWSLVQWVLPSVYRSGNWRRGEGPTKGCRVIDEWNEMKTDSSWSASGNNDIKDRIMAICNRDVVPKIHPDKFQKSTSI